MSQSYGNSTYGLAKAVVAEGGNFATATDIEALLLALANEKTDRVNADAAMPAAETGATIRSKLGVTALSGLNTGDETLATIKSKLGISTLSGANNGDETSASIISKLGYTPAATGAYVLKDNGALAVGSFALLGRSNSYSGNSSTSTVSVSITAGELFAYAGGTWRAMHGASNQVTGPYTISATATVVGQRIA